jgi:hypothetical protein
MAINIKGIEFLPAKSSKSKSTRGGRTLDADVTFGTGATKRDGSTEYTMRIGIAQSFARLARFRKSERFDVFFAPNEKLGVITKSENGYFQLLGGEGGARLDLKAVIGPDDHIPFVAQTVGCEAEVCKDGSVVFMLPDCVSFDRNLRAEADAKQH